MWFSLEKPTNISSSCSQWVSPKPNWTWRWTLCVHLFFLTVVSVNKGNWELCAFGIVSCLTVVKNPIWSEIPARPVQSSFPELMASLPLKSVSSKPRFRAWSRSCEFLKSSFGRPELIVKCTFSMLNAWSAIERGKMYLLTVVWTVLKKAIVRFSPSQFWWETLNM